MRLTEFLSYVETGGFHGWTHLSMSPSMQRCHKEFVAKSVKQKNNVKVKKLLKNQRDLFEEF